MKILIGSHVGVNSPEYLVKSANETLSYGANCMMIYTGSPQSTIRVPLGVLKIDEFREILSKNNIPLNNIVIHAPYIVNLATSDKTRHNFATDFIASELIRSNKIGANKFVIHPGNATDCDRETAIKNISRAINFINIKANNNSVYVCLETMSGKGNEIGKTFEELRKIIDLVDNKELIGVCLDTCHIHDAGYNISNFDKILDMFDSIIGLSYLKVIHLNDSKNIKGASKDRHENIGLGCIGFKTLQSIVYNKRIEHLPKILETPWINGIAPYKNEILKLLTI